jgi:putative transposase
MDRFKSPRIESHQDLGKVMQYVDLNPKRAGMVVHPKDCAWTSFHFYAYGKADSLITPAPNYEKLGNSDCERQTKYLTMIEEILRSDWKEKRPYSSAPFVGNPTWVEAKVKQLRELISEKRKSWRKRFEESFMRSG